MHILRPPSFFFAKRIGAPYAPLLTSIRPEYKNVLIYIFSSANSLLSSGYSLRFGGGAPSSTRGISWKNSSGQWDRSTGYCGPVKTLLYFYFNRASSADASSACSPAASASSPPPKVERWVKFNILSAFLCPANSKTPICTYYCFLPIFTNYPKFTNS